MLGDLPARVAEPSISAHQKVHDESVQGSIGVALLANFRYAIDFPAKRLWVGARANTG